jgi:hypothetical protein
MADDLHRAFDDAGLPIAERLRFFELCEPRSQEELAADLGRAGAYVDALRRAAEGDPTVDIESAVRIAATLAELLAEQHGFEERRLLAGAISYFVSRRDVADDLDDLGGIDDDARVVRAVCRALGREDLARRI